MMTTNTKEKAAVWAEDGEECSDLQSCQDVNAAPITLFSSCRETTGKPITLAVQPQPTKAFLKNPTPEVCAPKIPPLNQSGRTGSVVSLSMPASGFDRLFNATPGITPLKLAGLGMVASLLWSSRKRCKHGSPTMRLVKPAALRFVDREGGYSNPATFVAMTWGCERATQGRNINGKVANTWYLPPWWDGGTQKVRLLLTPYQRARWNRRHEILRRCEVDPEIRTRV